MRLFKFTNSAAFLRDHIAGLPKKGRGEISRIAHHLSVSTTLVSQVLAGEKFFTSEQAQNLGIYLGLSEIEMDYLTFLLQKERAGSTKLKDYWNNKLNEIRERSQKIANRVQADRKLSEQDQAVFYSSPLYSAVRLFCSVGDGGKSVDEVATRFDISRPKAARTLRFLTDTGLCEERDGRFFLGAQKTHLESNSPHLRTMHSNWRLNAIQQSDNMDASEMMYTATVSLSKKDFGELREEMVLFVKKFLDKVHASPAEDIACFNLDFFWIKK